MARRIKNHAIRMPHPNPSSTGIALGRRSPNRQCTKYTTSAMRQKKKTVPVKSTMNLMRRRDGLYVFKFLTFSTRQPPPRPRCKTSARLSRRRSPWRRSTGRQERGKSAHPYY